MNGVETALLIILSIALAVFLVLAIIATTLIIKVLRHINTIAEKAESIADKAEAVSEFFQKSAGPLAIGRFITNMAEAVFQKRNQSNKFKEEDEDA